MYDLIMNAIVIYITAWQAGLFFENFGKGSMMENYLETLAKV